MPCSMAKRKKKTTLKTLKRRIIKRASCEWERIVAAKTNLGKTCLRIVKTVVFTEKKIRVVKLRWFKDLEQLVHMGGGLLSSGGETVNRYG